MAQQYSTVQRVLKSSTQLASSGGSTTREIKASSECRTVGAGVLFRILCAALSKSCTVYDIYNVGNSGNWDSIPSTLALLG